MGRPLRAATSARGRPARSIACNRSSPSRRASVIEPAGSEGFGEAPPAVERAARAPATRRSAEERRRGMTGEASTLTAAPPRVDSDFGAGQPCRERTGIAPWAGLTQPAGADSFGCEAARMEVRSMSRAARSCAGLTLAALAAAVGCAKKEAAPPPAPPAVEVATVVQKDVPIFQEWIGSLDGSVNAEVRPQIEGYVLKPGYREGFAVRAGEPLFEIDPRQFQATYDQARGNLSQYEATLANAKTTVARYRPLAAQKAISQQELDDAETKERTAQANVESAKAAMEKA